MLKITHILYSGLGGHGSVVFSYLREPLLEFAEHHLLFFGIENITDEYKQMCLERNVDYSYVEKKSGFVAAQEIYHQLKKQKPDIIVVHSLATIPIIAFYRLIHRTKVILVEHASLSLKRKIDNFYTRMGILSSDKIVYLTEENLKESQRRFSKFLKSNKIQIIANGIDLETFKPDIQQKEDLTLIIGTHCRLVEIKDIPTLIKAFGVLKADFDFSIKLKIAGDGNILDELKEFTRSLELENDVIFTGILKEKEVVKFLQETDIYVNTSEIESMSTSIMQAMGCGLPIVASNIAGNLNLVEEGKNGLFFELSNVGELANKLRELCLNENLRENLGKVSRKSAESAFSNQITINKYHELFKDLVK